MNRRRVMQFSVSNFQAGVALSARIVGRHGQTHGSSMLQMARGARWRECLIFLMDRCVVAGETGVVGHRLGKSVDARYVAEVALLREDRVRSRKRSAGVRLLIALDTLGQEPSQR